MGTFEPYHGKSLRMAFLVPLFLAVTFSSCSKAPPSPAPSTAASVEERSFEVQGILRSIDSDRQGVIIEHEDIPDFMPSMTMPFSVKNPDELNALAVGDAVGFRFVVSESDSWITHLHPIDRASLKLPESEPKADATNTPRLKEGDALPEFALVDEANRPLTRESLAGRATILTFIFTRCPIPNFCPLMSSNFLQLQQKLEATPALADQVRLLSISFDPEDTPQRLGQYATNIGASPVLWRHASGSKEETRKLTGAFSVYVRADDGGSFSHGLCTALITPEGTIAKLWRGNSWTVDEVWQALEDLKK